MPARPRRPYSERAQFTLRCRICGNHYTATRIDSRYCDATCRKAASRMKPAIEQMTATVNAAQAVAERGLFDDLDKAPTRDEIEQTLTALDALWPDLQPWIRAMLARLACKRRQAKSVT